MAENPPSPSLEPLKFFSWQRLLILLLLAVILILMLAIIKIQHDVRYLETQYSKALVAGVSLHEQQGKLLLEKHHLSALPRVEFIAENQLNMFRVTNSSAHVQTIYLFKGLDSVPQ